MADPVAAGVAELRAMLASFVKDNRLYGAAAGVVHGNELAWSDGAGFADAAAERQSSADTLYRIASITKTFTGTAILQLRDEARLNLDDAAVRWIPELADSASPAEIAAVTIRRLLSHESGLVSEPPGTDWSEPVYEGVTQRTLARVGEIFTAVPPNTQPKYSNLGYQLLGEIVQRASGMTYPDYVRQRILEPLGMSATTFEPVADELSGRCATGYGPRAFSDELEVAPTAPRLWAEGGLWCSVRDLATWVSVQLGAYADQPVDSPVLAAGSLREMHKPRYLSDDEWTRAWGISWYAVRKDDVIWIQHSGGLPGFITGVCFDPKLGVGGIALINGVADAPALAMDLAGIARRLVQASPPVVAAPSPAPESVKSLLGLYAPADMSELVRLEWRDGKLSFQDPSEPSWQLVLEPCDEPDTFRVGPGLRESGETARFRRRTDGQVASVFVGGGTLLRLGPVPADTARDGGAVRKGDGASGQARASGQVDGASGAVRRRRQGP